MELMEHQLDAVENLGNGKILHGIVGSGKSAVALAYYMKNEAPKNIYVITTAKKRDSLDWQGEAAKFGIGTVEGITLAGVLKVDSWNNIDRHLAVEDAFFIFDEQRLVGHGAWVKAYLKIAKKNHWIMLTGTPGDTWLDYAPVMIANGFYKNITDFKLKHVLYEPFSKYPKIRMYLNESRLEWIRNDILVEMPYNSHTTRLITHVDVEYDLELFKQVYRDRWHIYEDRPLKDMAETFRVMRRVVNSDPSRMEKIRWLMSFNKRLIIFYNFNYELDILRELYGEIEVGEWNGHRKTPVPETEEWVYLVQYVAGAESWNCTSTNSMAFYSLTYSYKNYEQAQGRTDRLNTLYTSLYYYTLVSNSIVDRAILNALGSKKNFNERKWVKEFDQFGEIEVDGLESCQI